MAEPIRVTATRGDTVESVHRVHAVAVRDGKVEAAAGDPGFVTFMRSAAKPIQAQPVSRARLDLTDRDLAIASASHLADDHQLIAVAALLAKAPATEDDLECGIFDGSRLRHNCSGKHAGMLALCRATGWPTEGYRLASHPCQQAMLSEVVEVAEVNEIPTAVDGCGVVTFALPLQRMAAAFTRIDERVAAAMRAHPELIRGRGALDTTLMQTLPGWTAKGGAEGLLCATGPDGLGIALKTEDGQQRALAPALGAFLDMLGLDGSSFGAAPVHNSRGEVVGTVTSL